MKSGHNAKETLTNLESGGKTTKHGTDVTRFLFRSVENVQKWFFEGPHPILNHLGEEKYFKKLLQFTFNDEDREEMNRYIIKNLTRLEKYAREDKPEQFTSLAKILSNRSKLFRMKMLENGIKDWWKESPKAMGNIWISVNYILLKGKYNFRFKRIMIPKGNGEMRPLAVPDKEWRVVSRWMLDLFQIWISPREKVLLNDYQFGGRPGRNTTDAWNSIWEEILNKKYIAEFDVTKCFDSVYHYQVEKCLIETLVPNFLNNFVIGVITHSIKNLSSLDRDTERMLVEDKNTEDYTNILWKMSKWPGRIWNAIAGQQTMDYWIEDVRKERNWRHMIWANEIYQKTKMKIKVNKAYWVEGKGNRMPEEEWPDAAKINYAGWQARVEGMERPSGNFWKDVAFTSLGKNLGRGIPQGWALSPLIANLTLRDTIPPNATGVLYLDDGVVGADTIEDLDIPGIMSELKTRGYTLSPGKFSWIKWEGETLKPLKFLGLETEGTNMKGATRKGSEISWKVPKLSSVSRLASRTEEYNPIPSVEWSNAINKQIYGPPNEVATAYMYNDGKIYDTNGVATNWDRSQAWVQSLRTQKMRRWMEEYPKNALELLEAIKRDMSTPDQNGELKKNGPLKVYYERTIREEKKIWRRISKELAGSREK